MVDPTENTDISTVLLKHADVICRENDCQNINLTCKKDIMTLIYHNAEQNWSLCDVKHITNPNKKIVHSEC